MLKNDRLGTKTWRLVSLLACAAAAFAGCSGPESSDSEPTAASQVHGVVSDGLVISQVYGGGGNPVDGGSPTYGQDFIELFNRALTPISVAGLSLQYAAEKGAFANNPSTNPVISLPDKEVPPGGYFLIALAGGDAGAAGALPTPEATGTNNLSASGGKIALVRGTDSLGCGASVDAGSGVDGGITECDTSKIIDLVGYGKPNYAEGTAAPGGLGATQSIQRKGAGCTETDSNKGDFELVAPTARNSATPVNVCATDAGAPDAEIDANPGVDAAPEDAGPADGGGGTPEDSGTEDAALADGGGGTPEDAGVDAATPEDGGTDAGPTDAGPADASTDSGTQPIGTGIVISQVYGAGGNANALRNRDYIELFNRSSLAVSLAGLSVQYGSGTGDFAPPLADGGSNNNNFALPNVTLDPGKYYLVAMTKLANGEDVAFDVEGALSMGAKDGKVALARTTASLNCGKAGNPCDLSKIVDLVGYGAAAMFEGAGATPELSATLAAFRKNAGCTDTDNNAGDFTTGAPAPRSNALPAAVCSTTPTDGGTGDGGTGNPDSGTGRPDAGKSDAGTGNPFDSGTPPRNDGGSGNGAVDVDSGCSCSTPGSSTPMNKGLAFATFAALGLAITARRRRAS